MGQIANILRSLDDYYSGVTCPRGLVYCRCYALGEISPASAEFKEANGQFEKLTTDILTNALHKEDNSVEKRLVVKLHEACGFDQVGSRNGAVTDQCL